MGEVVCEICGSGSNRPLIAKCVECSSYQHRYCVPVVAFTFSCEWICSECQEKANGDPIPNQDGQNELQSACGMTNERETPKLDLDHSNVVHQISPYARKGFSSAKVKFISSEEVALLNRDMRRYSKLNSAMRHSQVRSMSPPSSKQYYTKCASPTRSDTQPPALTQCTAASHGHEKIENRSDVDMRQSQVRSASPLNLKQSSSMKCVSPSRSGTQVHPPLKRSVLVNHDKANIENGSESATRKSQLPHASIPNVKQPFNRNCIPPNRSGTQTHALKRCVAASHEAREKDLSMNRNTGHSSSMLMTNRSRTEVVVKGKVDYRMEDKTKEKKIVSADKGKNTSQIQHECRKKDALRASVDATGCESGMKSPSHIGGTILIIDSTVEHSRRPSSINCWTGCLHVLDAGSKHNLGEFKAYFPSKVRRNAYDTINTMPSNLQLEMLPRMDDWPRIFETRGCFHEDIALFFLANKFDWHEKKHPHLLETSCNYVMRAYINDIKLLIYSSEVLPPDSQWIDGKNYLWGVFVRPKGKRSQHLSST